MTEITLVQLSVDASLEKRGGAAGRIEPSRLEPPMTVGEIQVVDANVDHVDAISQLIDYWARQGENLPRSRDEIFNALSDFAVALHQGQVVGCASLYIYGANLAEIRSLGVDPLRHGLGVGSALVKHFLAYARHLHIPRVFVLTRAPEFFNRNGFSVAAIDLLPEKVFKDCSKCTKRSKCDEIAMICEICDLR